MNEIITGRQLDKLIKRRSQIVLTLHHLANEQKQVEQNTDWLDQMAYESRVNLRDRLCGWYATEIEHIDNAVERIERDVTASASHATKRLKRNFWRRRRRRSFVASAKTCAMGCAAFELT
jgi:hypothetical protein